MTATFKKSTVREYVESIIIAVILALFIRTWVFQAFKIPTGSMEENLLVGDHLVVNKFAYAPTALGLERAVLPVGTIARGDVLVFKYPQDPERDFIKRVIGLPGETIELRNKTVHINGESIEEPYVQFLTPPAEDPDEVSGFDLRARFGPQVVPDDHYFMMGDNRDNSQDSRYWGPVPREYIKGRALMIYWSYEPSPRVYVDEGVGGGARRAVSTITGFFTSTRWSRLGHLVR